MDSHPKVMTVSYGTFSCTLDGFDDPFTTMQLVAEYFRKLSANDRYFGGEPLQPDASKLHQIAKSANPNRIDAEVSDNSVILRQADVVDVPSNPASVTTDTPAQSDEIVNTPSVEADDMVEVAHDDAEMPTAFTSRRKSVAPVAPTIDEDSTAAEEVAAEIETPEPELEVKAEEPALETEETVEAIEEVAEIETVEDVAQVEAIEEPAPVLADDVPDALTASLNENINDTTTADELAPSLEEEIPSETVSAAVKALKNNESIDRWLETANEKMATPEHVSKANALERLKAAVAATEAERATRMEGISSEVVETGEERRDNTISFRRELSKVRKAYENETSSVFSRPKARAASGRSNGTSTRPLVLDMGQRIDRSGQDASSDSAQSGDLKKKAV